jgi:hypothetical protein
MIYFQPEPLHNSTLATMFMPIAKATMKSDSVRSVFSSDFYSKQGRRNIGQKLKEMPSRQARKFNIPANIAENIEIPKDVMTLIEEKDVDIETLKKMLDNQ